MVVYAGNGTMKSLFEVPVKGRQLARDEIAMLHDNIAEDLETLSHTAVHEAPPIEPPTKRVAAVEPPKVALKVEPKADPRPEPKREPEPKLEVKPEPLPK